MSELDAERAKASFPVRQLTFFLDGGREVTEKRERLQKLVQNDPVFDRTADYFLSHGNLYKKSIERIHRVESKRRELKLSNEDTAYLKNIAIENSPSMLHDDVFVANLVGLMSPEQQEKWVQKARSYEIFGCYAQTELGHGSNVRGLETTATFLPESDQFDIHSPTLTSTKWWPGAMGKTANFAVVYARLILPDGDHGVHPFLVQIRSLENHKPLPGISVGDIGPKFGYNGNDNGYLRFDHVKIPRDQMPMRYSKVSREGKYSKPPHDKLAYGTMLSVRTNLVRSAFTALARGLTIAVRYSAVRRQGSSSETENNDGGKLPLENKILDYKIQQYRLLPLVSTAYALQFTGRYMNEIFKDLQKGLASGDLSTLPEAHATSSGLKSLTTRLAADGIEECRKACGGHGYLLSSGLPTLLADYLPACTAEGDNYLLTQQTSRYLLKAYQQGQEGKKLSGNARYLEKVNDLLNKKSSVNSEPGTLDPAFQLEAYQHRAALTIQQAAEQISRSLNQGKSFEEAWNNALIEINRASVAHCFLIILISFQTSVENARKNHPEIYPVLKRLQDLFALYNIEQNHGDFTERMYLSSQQVGLIRTQVRNLLDQLRSDAIPLVDAFDFPDFILNSALGRYDGKVYEALWEMAQLEPLNQEEVVSVYDKFLKPMFKREGTFKSAL